MNANHATYRMIKRWMRDQVPQHTDQKTGEINCTELAEAAAEHMDLYEKDGSTIPEWVFEIAARFPADLYVG